jgi:SAM-dependent methyltransferase
MHDSVYQWTKEMVDKYDLDNSEAWVLETGSCNFNGSVRDHFTKCDNYMGIDMQAGPGVDVVVSTHDMFDSKYIQRNSFDVVMCTEMLEHDPKFWVTMQNLYDALDEDGILVLTARGATADGRSFWEHGYPNDYWRFMPQSFPLLFDMFGFEMLELKEDWQQAHHGWLGVARKI